MATSAGTCDIAKRFVGRTLRAQRPQRADQRKPRHTAAGNAINESNQPYNIFNYGTEPYSVRFLSQSLSFFLLRTGGTDATVH